MRAWRDLINGAKCWYQFSTQRGKNPNKLNILIAHVCSIPKTNTKDLHTRTARSSGILSVCSSYDYTHCLHCKSIKLNRQNECGEQKKIEECCCDWLNIFDFLLSIQMFENIWRLTRDQRKKIIVFTLTWLHRCTVNQLHW